MRKTFFIDIDGTLLYHEENFEEVAFAKELPRLKDSKEMTVRWHCEGHMIILTTARPECMRPVTELQLHNAGILYDKLVMGVGSGDRILINDHEPNGPSKARAYSVRRNIDGLSKIYE